MPRTSGFWRRKICEAAAIAAVLLHRAGGLAPQPAARRLEFTRAAALLLLLVDRAPGLLLKPTGPENNFFVHQGFLARSFCIAFAAWDIQLKKRLLMTLSSGTAHGCQR
jgi:hypothetical protein